jgi:hypothetical protein
LPDECGIVFGAFASNVVAFVIFLDLSQNSKVKIQNGR